MNSNGGKHVILGLIRRRWWRVDQLDLKLTQNFEVEELLIWKILVRNLKKNVICFLKLKNWVLAVQREKGIVAKVHVWKEIISAPVADENKNYRQTSEWNNSKKGKKTLFSKQTVRDKKNKNIYILFAIVICLRLSWGDIFYKEKKQHTTSTRSKQHSALTLKQQWCD